MNWKEVIESKIFVELDILLKETERWKAFNERVVFTNGCFDLIHKGHMDYLAKAASLGDRMIIGLNADSSVKALKGSERPIFNESTRALKLASLVFVDAVILFSEETPIDLITSIAPDILVKGGDYTVDTIVGATEVLNKGGKVETIPFLVGHSSSTVIEKIKNS